MERIVIPNKRLDNILSIALVVHVSAEIKNIIRHQLKIHRWKKTCDSMLVTRFFTEYFVWCLIIACSQNTSQKVVTVCWLQTFSISALTAVWWWLVLKQKHENEYNRQIILFKLCLGWCQWPHVHGRTSAAPRLLRLWVRMLPGAWKFFCCECYVLSGRGLCDELITRLEESYQLLCVVLCDVENLWIRRPWPIGAVAPKTNKLWL